MPVSHPDDAYLDPEVGLERLLEQVIVQHTCEWCGCVYPDDVLGRQWGCRAVKQAGYTRKHWRMWRVCPKCNREFFNKWVTPIIANMPQLSLVDILAVQPIAQPVGQVFYMNLVWTAWRARRRIGDVVVLDDAGPPRVARELRGEILVNLPVPAEHIDLDFRIIPDGIHGIDDRDMVDAVAGAWEPLRE